MNYFKKLMNMGVLIEPDANSILKNMEDESLQMVVTHVEDQRPLVLTRHILEKFLKEHKFKIIYDYNPKEKLTIQDYVQVLSNRYNKLQEILVQKVGLSNIVSIRNCSNGKVSVIGMVKEVKDADTNLFVTIEDLTGSVNVIVPITLKENINLDDIVAVSGNYNNKTIVSEMFLFPDVLITEPSYTENNAVVAVSNKDVQNNFDYLIVPHTIESHEKYSEVFVVGNEVKNSENFHHIRNPTLLTIEGIKILIAFDVDPLLLLKKRYVSINHNDFILEDIPDIVFTNLDINKNYKGITIVGINKEINLKDREIKEL